jgi:hypothetical protein
MKEGMLKLASQPPRSILSNEREVVLRQLGLHVNIDRHDVDDDTTPVCGLGRDAVTSHRPQTFG